MTNIPDVLTSISGIKIKTVKDWESFRRPEIMNLMKEYIYGVRPVERPQDLSFKTTNISGKFNKNNIQFEKKEICFCEYSFPIYSYYPLSFSAALPSFVYIMHEYQENNCDLENSIECANLPIKNIIDNGYALFIMPTRNLAPDFEHHAEYSQGIYPLFESKRKGNSWASISAWSWGASRVMDYIETDTRLNSSKVTVVGHSRGGKTALWCAATDKRFMCAISNNSGCAGAAMHRTKAGEHIKDINRTDWFCENYKKFNENEDMLPVDQHMLIAAIAPRPCYVSSSSEDTWADPAAERYSCRLASRVYELYNKKGAILPSEPIEENTAYHDGMIGYHMKSGKHSITHYDWEMFLNFLSKK